MKKILVSIDESLLREVDTAAQKAGVSRSAWLAQQAARGIVGRGRSEGERAEAARAEMHRAYRAAARTSAPVIPTALELKRMHDERLDKVDRAGRRTIERSG